MAVIKVFDSVGVKTVKLMGNLSEQDYDEQIDEDSLLPDFDLEDEE